MKKQIIALGGGGFSMTPENPLLDNYILAQANSKKPKICFLGTASGDAASYSDRFMHHFSKKNCIPNRLSLFKGAFKSLEETILNQDIIYVGGGNTRNMLALWREWYLDEILFKAYNKGIILSGLSAGAICWFEEGLTDSVPFQLNKLECLGFLKGSCCPHFDGETERQESYKSKILSSEMKAGFAIDDSVGIHFINGEIHQVISAETEAKAYYYANKNGNLKQQILNPKYLK